MDAASTDISLAKGPGISPLRAWSSVFILLLFAIFSVIDRQIISLLVGPIKADLQLSDTQIGLLQGLAFAIFYSVAGVPLGWAADRFPRKIVIYCGLTLWSLSAAACGLASNFWQLFIPRTAVGVGEAALSPSAVSLISDLFPSDKVGAPLGVYATGFSIGSGLALVVSGFVVGLFAGSPSVVFPIIGAVAPWQAVFIVTGLPGVFIAMLAFALTDRRPGIVERNKAAAIRNAGTIPQVERYFGKNWKLLFLTYGGFGWASFLFYAIGGWTPAFLSRSFGLLPAQIGLGWGFIVAASGGIGALGGGFVIDRVYRTGRTDACILVPGVSAILAFPFVVFGYLLPSPTLVLCSLGVGLALLGIVSAGSFATWQRISPPHLRGRISGAFALVAVGMGASMGPVVPALVTDYILHDEARVGWSLSITVACTLPLLAIMLLGARRLLRAMPV